MSALAYRDVRSYPVSSTALGQYLRAKLSAGSLALAGATDKEIGVMENPTFTTDTKGSVRMLDGAKTIYCVANGAITINTDVYRAANGQVSATASGAPFGFALSAATGTGSVLEVKPYPAQGLRVVSGQATTVTAIDTIATGLNTLTSVVVSYDSDIVDNPEWATASIGDQAGTPVAGSFVLKTWQNTSGSDPTPVAASTFGKKINWIATGN